MQTLFPHLAQTSCWLLTADGPIFGLLTLSAAELAFEPAPGDDEHRLRLPHTRILAATVTPLKRRLMVQGADQTWWFDGPSVHSLGRRLSELLHPADGRFASDEHLIASTPITCGLLRGDACLTDRRLYFQARGLWGLLGPVLQQPARWDVPLHAIQASHEALTVRLSPERTVTLRGAGALLLATHLQHKPQLVWPARWWEGWRPRTGVLALHPDRVQLRDRSQAGDLELPLHRVRRMRRKGGWLQITLPQRRLSVDAGGSGLLLRQLAKAVLAQPQRSLDPDRQPVLWWHSADDAWVGHLQANLHRLLFSAPEGEVLLDRAMTDIRRAPAPPTQIRLQDEQGQYRFEPAHRGGLVEHFWQNYRPPERIQPWPETGSERREMLTGQRSVWVTDHRRYDVLLQPGMLIEADDGFGVVLSATNGAPPEDTPLTVELGRPDGVYQFDTRLVRTTPLPDGMRFPRNGSVAILAHPKEVRFYNQRKAYRVPLKMPVNAWRLRLDQRRNTWIPDGDRLSGQLLDLSVSGCGVHTDTEVTVGEHLFLELLIAEHWLPLEAECVRAEPGWPEGSTLGLQFLNLPERLEQLLNQTILQQQRADAGMMAPE